MLIVVISQHLVFAVPQLHFLLFTPSRSARILLCAECVWGTGGTKCKSLFWMCHCILIPSRDLPSTSRRPRRPLVPTPPWCQPPASSIFSQPLTFVDVLSCLFSSSRTLLILAPLWLLSASPPPLIPISLRIHPQSSPFPYAIYLSSYSFPFTPIFSHFCSFPCGSVRSLLPPTPFILFLTLFPSPHFLPFSLFSWRIRPQSATFPDAIHLPPIPVNYIAISHPPDTFFFPQPDSPSAFLGYPAAARRLQPRSQIFIFVSAPSQRI